MNAILSAQLAEILKSAYVCVCACLLSLALVPLVHGGLAKTSPHIDLCEKGLIVVCSYAFTSQHVLCVYARVRVAMCTCRSLHLSGVFPHS